MEQELSLPDKIRRTRARRFALQLLYQYQYAPQSPEQLLQSVPEGSGRGDMDHAYLHELLENCVNEHAALEARYVQHFNRPLEQIDPVTRAILWISAYEMLYRRDIPAPVIIDEAIQLSHAFGATDSYKFINAVLEKVQKQRKA